MANEIERVAFSRLLEYDAARMRRAAVKLTHVGEQTGPIPTLVISSCFQLPRMDLFRHLRTAGNSYQNDELPEVLNFSVLPETLWEILSAVVRGQSDPRDATSRASLSVMAYVTTDEHARGSEELLSRDEGVALHRTLDTLIRPTCPVGAAMLRTQRGSTYSDADLPSLEPEK